MNSSIPISAYELVWPDDGQSAKNVMSGRGTLIMNYYRKNGKMPENMGPNMPRIRLRGSSTGGSS